MDADKQKFKLKPALLLKGMAMGAADIVPGVSGGTIAFITGIYEELLRTIRGINFGLIGTWRREGLVAMWKKANLGFLLTLFAGIAISLFSLARIIGYFLEHHAHLLWAFFFGLVVASVWLVGKEVKSWNGKTIFALIVGTAFAYWVTILPPMTSPEALWYLFLSGAIAACAMILPGISGSFILLLLGSYITFTEALATGDIVKLVTLVAGAGLGLILFSRLLTWLFENTRNVVIATLAGFLIGSLNKLWPWKQVTEVFIKHPGEADEKVVNLMEHPVAPSDFAMPEVLDGKVIGQISQEPQVGLAIACFVGGLATILLIEWIARKLGMEQK